MTSDVAYEVDSYPARTLVMEITIEAEGAQMALKFAAEEGSGLAAACCTRLEFPWWSVDFRVSYRLSSFASREGLDSREDTET